MEWDVLEHPYRPKSNDWFISLIVLSAAIVAVEFFFNNFVLILLTVIAAATTILIAQRRPGVIHVEIGRKGLVAGEHTYLYRDLDAFDLVEYPWGRKILIESKKRLAPLITIPIGDEVDALDLHDILEEYLEDKEIHEPWGVVFLERIGF